MEILKRFLGIKPNDKSEITLDVILPPNVQKSFDEFDKENQKENDKTELWCLLYKYCEETLRLKDVQLITTTSSGLELHGHSRLGIIKFNGVELIKFYYDDIINNEPVYTPNKSEWILEGPWSENALSDFKIHFGDIEEKREKEKQRNQELFDAGIRESLKDYKPTVVERYNASERISGDTTYC